MTSLKTAVTAGYLHAHTYENNKNMNKNKGFFYKYHFGIIGADKTKMVDNTIIF